ncbi:hypothetical protein PVK06_035880 [Gossypium arboreum]|uniref:Reverse transcriptase n=1 Tax=Gossypium arboreum TaxID=29729 RepID=A0ABR0NKB8_GOSAR|nr:hypothetical protein PVK06_035880 [Gossypium arboreum]
MVNLSYKRVANNIICPRCGVGEEDSYHVFRQCPAVREIWSSLNLSWGVVVRDQMGVFKASNMTLHENISSSFVEEAHTGLEAIKSENVQANNLVKGALEKSEASYLVREERSHSATDSEGRWKKNRIDLF